MSDVSLADRCTACTKNEAYYVFCGMSYLCSDCLNFRLRSVDSCYAVKVELVFIGHIEIDEELLSDG